MKRMLCVALALLLLCGCTAAPAQTTVPAEEPVLKAGFYLYGGDMGSETLVHFYFQEDGTWLLFVGDEEDIKNAFSVQPREGAVFLPHVMSRKKQIIPSLSALWG